VLPLSRPALAGVFLLIFCLLLATLVVTKAQAPPSSYANFEPAQTNPIRLSADGTRLFAVNSPNNSVSVFDVTVAASPSLLTEIPVGVGPVSVAPLTDDEAWVVNQVSNSVSVISVSRQIVTDTIQAPIEPMDVVFAGVNKAYVSCSRNNVIDVFDTNTHSLIKAIQVFGGNPHALAVGNGGSTVYAAFALSGNATTLIPANLAPPQPPPTNTKLPPPPQVGLIVAATDPAWTRVIKFKMPDNDVVAISTGASPAITGYYSGVGTINLGLAVNPVNGDLFVANTDALNLTFFEPALCGHWVNNRITRIQASSGQITPFDLNPSVQYGCAPNPSDLSNALAQPASVVFDPSGDFMYVAAFGTDRVAQVDTNGNVLSRVEVAPPSGSGSNVDPAHKRGPRGLALNAAANTLYCLNRLADTISIINTSANVVSSEIQLTDPTPPTVKQGRGFLYDAKLSGTGDGACASCHVDGDMDHLAWNLGDPGGSMTSVVQNGKTLLFHPMKGPMTTQTLRGLLNLSPYHWRGDKANLAAFNSAFASLMGGSEISSQNMALFTDFVNSILYLPNPHQNLDRTYPTSFSGGNAAQGQSDFVTVAESLLTSKPQTCNSCHTANPGPGSDRLITTDVGQPMKTAQLRNEYQKTLYNKTGSTSIEGFGITHDGHTNSLVSFFKAPVFAGYTQTQVNDIAAFELCFDTGTAPAVGHTRTLLKSNVKSQPYQSDWMLLQSQALAGNIDLIGRGTIQGQVHGLLYQPATSNYLSDTGATYTQAELQAFVLAGDTLSIMGVYPGTGTTH